MSTHPPLFPLETINQRHHKFPLNYRDILFDGYCFDRFLTYDVKHHYAKGTLRVKSMFNIFG